MKALPLLLLAVAPLAAAGRAHAGSCPANRIELTGTLVTSDRAAYDTTGINAHGSYDLRAGRLASNVLFNDPGWSSSSVATDDLYWIVGLPAGTPVDFTAQYTVSGSWNVYPGVPQGNFTCAGSIAGDADSAGFAQPQGGCCHSSVSQPLVLPLHRHANEPFHLRLRVASQDYRGRVDLAAALTFAGLPAGAAVVSCQGYASAAIAGAGTPASGATGLGLTAIRPNPTSGSLLLSLRLPEAAPARVDVLDALGRRVLSRTFAPGAPGTHALRLDEVAGLRPGVYRVRVTQSERTATAAFVTVR